MVIAIALALAAATPIPAQAELKAQMAAPPLDQPTKLYPETKDRLSDDQMNALVAGPSAALAKRDLPLAEKRFDALLAQAIAREGLDSLTAADLETSWGLALYMAAQMEEYRPAAEPSILHFRRSVDAYTRHFGRRHAETALALTSLSDAIGELNDKGRVAERIPLIREAFAIRRATLGERHPETLASRMNLIVLLTRPEITDPTLFREAAALAEEARTLAMPGMPAGHLLSIERLKLAAAMPMIRLGQVDQAMALVAVTMTEYRARVQDSEECVGMARTLDDIRDSLKAAHAADRATEIQDNVITLCIGDLSRGAETS